MPFGFCAKQGWFKQEGSGGRGTRWHPTDKGRKELKEEKEIHTIPQGSFQKREVFLSSLDQERLPCIGEAFE
jgi:hypothetical protein